MTESKALQELRRQKDIIQKLTRDKIALLDIARVLLDQAKCEKPSNETISKCRKMYNQIRPK